MTKAEANKLLPQAREFVKKCNAFPVVHAMEGGALSLDELLVDFVKYLDDEGKSNTDIPD